MAGYALRKWPSYFAAPLYALFGAFFAAIPLALFGLLFRTDVGLVIAGACWFLPLVAGLFIAELLVGLFFGFPLMWATISAEGTDAFDALSRSYAYTYRQPLLYALYSLVAGALGMLGWLVVAIFISTIVDLGAWGVSWCGGDRIAPDALAGFLGEVCSPTARLPTRSAPPWPVRAASWDCG